MLSLLHIYGQTSSLNTSLCLGITLRLWEYVQAEEIMEALAEEAAAVFIGVPTPCTTAWPSWAPRTRPRASR